MTTTPEILEDYSKNLASLSNEESRLKKISFQLSILRLFFFIILIVLTIWTASISNLVALIVGAIGTSIFLQIIKLHHRKEQEREVVSFKNKLLSNEVLAINKKLNDNYNGEKFIDPNHYFSNDLDVFGSFSLFGLINRSRTYQGINLLAKYLESKPPLSELQSRNIGIQELENKKGWRLDFLSSLYQVESGATDNVSAYINEVLSANLSFATGRILTFYRRILPLIWLLVVAIYFVQPDISIGLAVLLVLTNFKITSGYAEAVTCVQFRLSKAGTHLDKYASSLSIIYDSSWTSTYLKELVLDPKIDHIKGLKNLKNISDLLDYRLHMIPSFVLNVGLLWDSIMCARLSKWHEEFKGGIDEVFNLIGSMEALTSLATWSYNHPEFCYPEFDEEYFHLKGIQMRHPLLVYEECVPNDFSVTTGDYVGIITGSNMSGKSTFLRTVGLNIILGNCGTRVAASSFNYSLCQLITYMRIRDALEENVSTFKSELNRVVKMLESIDGDEPTFILADEMLRGTNSEDKLKGSKAIVKRIADRNSYALVATHDIGLAHLGDNSEKISNYFFDIDFADGNLVFDYKIKSGICQSFNASFLLKQLGLDLD